MNEHVASVVMEIRGRITALQDLEQRLTAEFGVAGRSPLTAPPPPRAVQLAPFPAARREASASKPKKKEGKKGKLAELDGRSFGSLVRQEVGECKGPFTQADIAERLNSAEPIRVGWVLKQMVISGQLRVHMKGRPGHPASYEKTGEFMKVARDVTQANQNLLEEIKREEAAKLNQAEE